MDENRFKTHGMRRTRFWRIWSGMKNRCDSKSIVHNKYRGNKGITYSYYWDKFENFKDDMYESYQQHVEEY